MLILSLPEPILITVGSCMLEWLELPWRSRHVSKKCHTCFICCWYFKYLFVWSQRDLIFISYNTNMLCECHNIALQSLFATSCTRIFKALYKLVGLLVWRWRVLRSDEYKCTGKAGNIILFELGECLEMPYIQKTRNWSVKRGLRKYLKTSWDSAGTSSAQAGTRLYYFLRFTRSKEKDSALAIDSYS